MSIVTWMAVLGNALDVRAKDADSDWNQWRGPSRDSVIRNQPFPESIAHNDLVVDWKVQLESSYSSPVIAGDRVFTTETLDKKQESVKAFNRRTGELLWQQTWDGSMKVPFFAASNGSWIRSTPAYSDNRLYVGGMRDVLKCLNTDDGSIVWSIDFPEMWETKLPSFGLVSSPLVEGDHVYVQAGAAVVKINKSDGQIVWKSMEDKGGMMDSAFSSPILADIHGMRQLVVQTREDLAGLDLSTGSVLWQIEVPSFRGMNILTPTIQNNSIFTSSYKNKSWLYEIQKDDPNQTWSAKESWVGRSPAYMSSPVLIDNHLYVHLQSQRLVCIDWSTGETRWTSERSFGKYWSMIAQGDKILALDQNGTLYLVLADPEKLILLQERKVSDEDTWAHLAISGNQIFIRELNGLIAMSFDPNKKFAHSIEPKSIE